MGTIIQIDCPGCGLSEMEFVGVEMMGKGTALVVCERCQRFVRKQLPDFQVPQPGAAYQCPYCRQTAVEVTSESTESVPCPQCRTTLSIFEMGSWD